MFTVYPTGKYTLFYGHKEGPMAIFSNFYPIQFTHRDIVFENSEQALMYEKALLFEDRDAAALILQAKTPFEAKSIGRKVKNFNEATWKDNRLDIMVSVLESKFVNSDALLATEDSIIVECSPSDRIWGIGMKVCADAADQSKWRGLNVLGQALCIVRDKQHA
jgi:ribA/ribD-fused uncharacterized protein